MKESKSTLSYMVGRSVLDYWHWWTEELQSATPLRLRQLLFNAKKLILEINGDTVEVYLMIGNKKNQIANAAIHDISANHIRKYIKESNVTDIIVSIPEQQVLEKNVSFPLATEENIREVLSFEMDRLTPFTSNQVYYDYYIISRNKQKNKIDLKLIIIPKEKIDNLLKDLDQMGYQPQVVTVHGEKIDKNAQINLLPIEKRAKKINALKIVNYSLIGVLSILFLISLLLPIWNKINYIKTLDPELSEYTQSAEKIMKLRKQVDNAEEEALFLVEKKRATVLMLQVLDELTQIIPDDTWANQVDVNDDEVHVYGESVSSASLLPIIESSKIFSNPQFRSPVTQNRQNNTERFHLSAKIKQEDTL